MRAMGSGTMATQFDAEALGALFLQPNLDGSFAPEQQAYLNQLGARRPSVILAFAPKAAGTYLRTAAITAINGKLVRTIHAQGGRDSSFYLPFFLLYYAGNVPPETMVTHVHMQALAANRHFMDAFDLKPAVMLRSIPDMLASYADMVASNPAWQDFWINLALPLNYASLDEAEKSDFLVDMVGPWYASYFSTWQDYAAAAPKRVLMLRYDEFVADPVLTMETLLAHSGVPRSAARCQAALNAVWPEREGYGFNKGVSGRGCGRFSRAQVARLRRQVDFYPNLADLREVLVPAG